MVCYKTGQGNLDFQGQGGIIFDQMLGFCEIWAINSTIRNTVATA